MSSAVVPWRFCHMARLADIYPPGPRNVPPDLTTPTTDYRLRVVVVLISLILFFLLYLALLAGSAYLIYWAIVFPLPRDKGAAIWFKIMAVGVSGLLFLFLLKGFF